MIDVSCAIILNEDDRILVVQRGSESDHPGKWEFPGGKVDEGESPEDSVVREISEELLMDIIITGVIDPVEYDYTFKSIRLIPFICNTLDEQPVLTEHASYRWVTFHDLGKVDLCEADVLVARRFIDSVSEPSHENSVLPAEVPVSKELEKMIEVVRSAGEANWYAGSAAGSPEMLNSLLSFTFSENKKLSSRAAWILGKLADSDPEALLPFMARLIDGLTDIGNESTIRSVLRILSLTDPARIDSGRHGLLADYCFNVLNSGFSSIGVRAYSMEILYNLVQIYPELTNELVLSLSLIRESDSAGIRARGRIILKKLSMEAKDQESSL